ncbi:hypothetical protein AMIS_2600 [Actinoplanes missouriensis 431]|uniref:Uncharacterized protein n=1 Tax=Actinoplanes missouriensis (strain ATCC 14538 / DSM 43046 / CBS 188.64 / JCM 3121 / NBRC 102363 / NCIMB 12654 / NRRL B-3342 / UNCC 431) TaxID=512565 RepID=I0GXJ3_ACTM4|nr:hypothetical protein [Actinoplanes missouriensis]BAL85480.1 hypothetical protein AMIS_2600 [Actinoplanes missouriensis 431]
MTNQHHQLRASAALHTLEAALAALDDRVDDEYRAIRAEQAARYEPLKSPTFGRRHALGGHGDPTGDAAGTVGTTRPNRYAELRTEVQEQLLNVSRHVPRTGYVAHPVRDLEAAIPAMSPRAADRARLWFDRIDGRIRRQLRIAHDRQLVPRIPCPDCDTTGLIMRLSPPLDARVIECTTCGSAWPRSEVLGGVSA